MLGSATLGVMVLRIAVGAALGGVIGYERDRLRRQVGLRTHMMVALASATFMNLSIFFREFQEYSPGIEVEVDVSRIAASVVSGIGFLAGGAILRTGLSVQGLTTASGLWLVTAIGMTAGSGMFMVAIAVTAIGMIILTFMRRLEAHIGDVRRHRIEVTVEGTPDELFQRFADLSGTMERVEYYRALDDNRMRLSFDLMVPTGIERSQVISMIESVPGVKSLKVMG